MVLTDLIAMRHYGQPLWGAELINNQESMRFRHQLNLPRGTHA